MLVSLTTDTISVKHYHVFSVSMLAVRKNKVINKNLSLNIHHTQLSQALIKKVTFSKVVDQSLNSILYSGQTV